MIRAAIFLCILGFLFACEEPNVLVPTDRGDDYYPLIQGKFLEYRVDSIIFDDDGPVNKTDTITVYVRETIGESYVDAAGDSVFQIIREQRNDHTGAWQVTELWEASRDAHRAMRVERNQRLVKMEFPLNAMSRWNPVQFVGQDLDVPVGTELIKVYTNWDGRVLGIDQSEALGGVFFDHVMTCRQADDDNEIERRYVLEKYARDVGLVFRVDTILDSRCKRLGDLTPCFGQPWTVKGEKGYILRQELINHN